jgi:hypothetical protein
MSRPASPPPLPAEFASAVRLPDYYADSPQAWFCSIDATFAASRVTRSITKFHSIGPLCRNPTAYADPYQELLDILLRSYGLSASQRTAKWFDQPGLGNNKPSVLQPATVKEIQTVLFLRKLLRYIRDLINPREFQDPENLTQRCNEI